MHCVHCHIGCICLTFFHCVFSNDSSNYLFDNMHSNSNCSCKIVKLAVHLNDIDIFFLSVFQTSPQITCLRYKACDLGFVNCIVFEIWFLSGGTKTRKLLRKSIFSSLSLCSHGHLQISTVSAPLGRHKASSDHKTSYI